MKTVYFVRHAKSSWDDPGLPDEERPLIQKGFEKTRKIIDYLNQHRIRPSRIISSPAIRALDTARLLAKGTGYPENEIFIERRIYDGYFDPILDLIYGQPDSADSVMIVGHNPTITQIVNLFVHPGIEGMPTSAVAAVAFDTAEWNKIPLINARLEFYIYPKMLKDGE